MMRSLKIALAADVLDLVNIRQIVAGATEALTDGCDTPAMRRLAGLNSNDAEEARVLLRSACREAGLENMSHEAAARVYATAVCREVLEAKTTPEHAARLLLRVSVTVGDQFHELDPFVYVAGELDSRPTERELLTRMAMDAARHWLAEHDQNASGQPRSTL
ncbi:MAG TPA: hypothetical protein VFK69_06850 [Candidatus Eisenbacteria bacterium]|nr:hypothetical protein [Candidatus Eisenbacteria bacterium]